jgi:hypothetical protein
MLEHFSSMSTIELAGELAGSERFLRSTGQFAKWT